MKRSAIVLMVVAGLLGLANTAPATDSERDDDLETRYGVERSAIFGPGPVVEQGDSDAGLGSKSDNVLGPGLYGKILSVSGGEAKVDRGTDWIKIYFDPDQFDLHVGDTVFGSIDKEHRVSWLRVESEKISSSPMKKSGVATFSSGPQKVHLLELYSSEGCSSCPPAEEWFSRLKSDSGLWKDFVPVQMHVDYWDNLGWKDVHASPDFTQRQRRYAAAWGSDSVYTPGFVMDGQEGRDAKTPRHDGQKAGILTLEVDGNGVAVVFKPEIAGGEYDAHVAALSFDVRSNIQRGENAGRTLRHDFLARKVVSGKMTDESGRYSARLNVSVPDGSAVAVWVTRRGDLEPVQAAGGFI